MSAYAHATMIAAPADPDAAKRCRLEYRLNDIYVTKKNELRKKFGLIDDDEPKNPKEMDERIKAGKFIIKGLNDDKPRNWFCWYEALRWRDPAVKEDQDGFDAAKKDLKKAFVETQDIIAIKDPEAGLEAMKAFEAL